MGVEGGGLVGGEDDQSATSSGPVGGNNFKARESGDPWA